MSTMNVALALCFACIVAMAFARDIPISKKLQYTDEEARKNLEAIEYFVNKTEMSPYTRYIVTTGLKRMKRAGGTRGDNTHWCCKEDPVYNKEYHTRAERQLVPVTKKRTTGGKCGFGGWSRCNRETTYTVQEVIYVSVVDTREVPATEWVNGCPDRKIVCCKGFILNTFVNNCMTNTELNELLEILQRNRDALDLLDMFGSGRR